MKKGKTELTIRFSAAEYLTYVATVGEQQDSIEMRYEDENIWLTQKMMATLYNVDVRTINYHIKKIFSDSELQEKAVIQKFRITAPDGKIVKSDASVAKNYLTEQEMCSLERIVSAYLDLAEDRAERQIPMTMEDWAKRLDLFLMADDREILIGAGQITAAIAKEKAETEFEKYRVVQDRLFISDFDKYLLELEEKTEK